MGADRERARASQLAQLPVEQRGALAVEAGEGLVEEEQLRVVQERPAEREPLLHPPRVRGDPLVPGVPETVALEQHADPLAPLGNTVETAVELEVLERGQLAVDERLVAQVADGSALSHGIELPSGRAQETREEAQQRALARAVATRDEQKAALGQLDVDTVQDLSSRRSALEAPGRG